MGITIGNNNVMQGNINIGDNARQIAKDFNQEFNSLDKILDLLRSDLQSNYNKEDKPEVLKVYDEFKEELLKPVEARNSIIVKEKFKFLSNAFSFVANASSIAGLILTLGQIF